jgi:RNA polymerase sigma-70 factor (ECF subfamily)
MKSVAMNLLGNTPDAEDAVQEAFLKLHRSLPGFKGESLLSTWLYRILVNTCYDMGRKRKRRPEPAPEPDAQETPDPPAPASDHALRLTIERALDRLPEPQRSVFLLFEVEGFKHREIGEILDIPEGTSKHALFVAKRELQECILASRRAGRSQ